MKGKEQRRTLWLGGALLIALLATQWVNGEDGGGDPVSSVPEQKAPKREVREVYVAEDDTAQLELERLKRRQFSAQAGDLFSPKSWIPPPPLMKAQPPSPPPLMFKYLGKVTEGDETRVFLALAEHNYVVKPGETINNQYRVDTVTDHTITFTYIPLNAKQMLSTGGGV
ncbi:MAG: secretion system X translation initiation factor [Nitrosospira sp.]